MQPSPDGRAARRARALTASALVLVVGLSLVWSVHPWYDPTNDGSMYIATARSLVAGDGYSYLGIPFLIRPPGFSCSLVPFFATLGTNFFALNLYVSLWGALGVLAFHCLVRERLGLVLGTLVPLVLWFNPGYQKLCNQVMSDVPGWTCLLGCLLLARWRARNRTLARTAVLGLAIGAASYMRSGDLLLWPAIVVAELALFIARRAGRTPLRPMLLQLGVLSGAVLLVLAPWAVRNRLVAPPPPADQTLLYSYSTGMWHADMGDPDSPRLPLSAVLARFPERSEQILHTLGTRLREDEARPWLAGGTQAIAWVLIAALLVMALWRRRPEEIFCLGTLLVVSIYFGYAGRLLLPVFAFALAALAELVRAGVVRFAGPRAGTSLAALGCFAALVLDWSPRAGWADIERLNDAYQRSAHEVAERLPPGARLGAYRGWHLAVFLDRPVYSCEQAIERGGKPSAAEGIIDKYGIDHLLLTPLGLPGSVQHAERAFAADIAQRYGTRDLGLVRVR